MIFGAVQLVATAGFLAICGLEPTPLVVSGVVLFAAAGVLFVVAGTRERVRVGATTLTWHQINGLGCVLLATGWVLGSLPVVRADPVFAVLVVAGGGSLGFLGYQSFVDGGPVEYALDP